MSEFDFDALLDEVLKEEAQAEPLPGMERRILTRMREEKVLGGVWARGWWLGAVALAACVVVAVAVHHWSGTSSGSHVAAPITAPQTAIARRDGEGDAENKPELKVAPFRREARRKISPARAGEAAISGEQVQVQVQEERLPKLDTFPAVTQKGSLLAELKRGDTRDAVQAIAQSPQLAQALLDLKAEQERPLQVDAIEIKPL
jgi:hypothetical protein